MMFGGRYTIVRPLGRGGMGDVFEVRIEATGGRAALKTLRPALAADRDSLERFRREAIAMGLLEHVHIARCFDFGIDDDGTAFLVTELFEGGTLQEALADGPLETGEAIRYVLQVAEALDAAHEAGVVHRDLKPSNVVLARGYDGRPIAKVIDFGIASVKGSATYQRLTLTGEIMGTPNYMAPEQLEARTVDERTDVYGLGALAYALLSGRPPYEGTTLAEIIGPLLSGHRPMLAALRPELPEVSVVVERAMAIEPADRWRSPREFCDQLCVHSAQPQRTAHSVIRAFAVLAAFIAGIVLVLRLVSSDHAEPGDAVSAAARLTPTVDFPQPKPNPPVARDAWRITTLIPPAMTAEPRPETSGSMEPTMSQTAMTQTAMTQTAMTQTAMTQTAMTQTGMTQTSMRQTGMTQTTVTQTSMAMTHTVTIDRSWHEETWENPPVVTTRWMPNGSDPATLARLMNSRALELGRCLRRAHAPAVRFVINCEFQVDGTLNVHSLAETNRQCIMHLLRPPPPGHPAASFTGPVRIIVRPEYPRAPR